MPGYPASPRHAARLVKAFKAEIHRQGGFGLVQKRGTKLPPFVLEALACLSRRPGWLVVDRKLGKGPYAGIGFRVVWTGARVLQRAVSGLVEVG